MQMVILYGQTLCKKWWKQKKSIKHPQGGWIISCRIQDNQMLSSFWCKTEFLMQDQIRSWGEFNQPSRIYDLFIIHVRGDCKDYINCFEWHKCALYWRGKHLPQCRVQRKTMAQSWTRFWWQEWKLYQNIMCIYGLRSTGAVWRAHFSHNIHVIYFTSYHSDPDVWTRPGTKPDGFKYYEFLLYVDNILAISQKSAAIMAQL